MTASICSRSSASNNSIISVNVGAGFQVFKDDGHRNARALRHPGAGYLSRDAFHRRTL